MNDAFEHEHLVSAEQRQDAFQELCAAMDLNPDKVRRFWEAGELDPDAGYDPASLFYGKDIASLVMLLESPLPQHAARA
jgi:hypothetical protein